MRIVVTTPTGNVGSRVLQLLVQAGIRPVALLRDPARLDPRWHDRVETVTADQTDADAVRGATRGADRLFWVNPPAPPDADPLEHQARAAEAVAGAVTANRIGFTVFQSSVGAELRHGAGDIDGLGRTEAALDATGADVLHLRCAFFFTNLLMQAADLQEGRLPTPWPLTEPLAWVDPRDVGDVAAARLLAGPAEGRRRVQAVHGPEDLSFGDAAEVLGGALGHPVEAVRISGDEFRAGLRAVGLSPAHVEAVAGMSEGLSGGFVPDDPRDPTTTTPTTLAAWAHTRLRAG